ncbi:antibiotic biosynthesis monooxygenase [Vibrio neptunius]|uniref:Antibiotic biosynthesis monooxygenase n=1 Tax=Vibrio neptunius TaxID=170651 RepID=A0ABS3A974_9VIBR|nr:hypothetical protein TW84_11630 [Vibrio neptunius]MBN3495441.1 antibiotic biosynthesis monooxygenase [Vibrio neptunius]MBN3517944.1 antibiotic biosynthesis monooxygenase [Vibrio neptunius]MBN3552284.1 antibiotic biosynthesis monooxygenase [Vibrio neptunius]MBN3580287.1 antibiotic biosynthesis monooxygenase [Vibrio neptunius]
MFRVIYEWRVAAEKMTEFQLAWQAVTDTIHETVPGALGSALYRSTQTPDKVLTIAKWHTRQDWEAFWGQSDPESMRPMRQLGERVGVETFDEVEDRTR